MELHWISVRAAPAGCWICGLLAGDLAERLLAAPAGSLFTITNPTFRGDNLRSLPQEDRLTEVRAGLLRKRTRWGANRRPVETFRDPLWT